MFLPFQITAQKIRERSESVAVVVLRRTGGGVFTK